MDAMTKAGFMQALARPVMARVIYYNVCPRCGTTVVCSAEVLPQPGQPTRIETHNPCAKCAGREEE